MRHAKQQSAVEFLTTYSWAILIMALFIAIVAVLALSKPPSSYLASSCNIEPSLPCTGTAFTYNAITTPHFYLLFTNNFGITMSFPYNGFNLTTTNIGSSGTVYNIGNCTPAIAPSGTPVVCMASIANSLMPATGAQTSTLFTISYQLCSGNSQVSCQGTVYKTTGSSLQTFAPSNTVLYAVTFQTNPTTGSIVINGATYVNNVVSYFLAQSYNAFARPPSNYRFSSWTITPPSTLSSTATQSTVLTVISNTVITATFNAMFTTTSTSTSTSSTSTSTSTSTSSTSTSSTSTTTIPAPYIFCVGGYSSTTTSATNSVYYAKVSSNGIGTWVGTANYPVPMTFAGCSISGSNVIYCVGNGNSTLAKNVYYAPVSSTGVGTWTSTTPYPVAMGFAGCSIYSNTIYCVGNLAVAATVQVGQYADGVAYNPSNGYMYVTNQGSSSVSVISGNTVVGTVSLTGGPGGIAYNPANNDMYVDVPGSIMGQNQVELISGTTNMGRFGVGSGPFGVAYNPSDGYMYVTNPCPGSYTCTGTVSVISGTNVISTVTLANRGAYGAGPAGIAYSPLNGYMYVANEGHSSHPGNVVSVISSTTELARIPVGDFPLEVAYNPSNGYMYATTASSVVVISGTNVIATITPVVGYGQAFGIAYDPNTGYMYVNVESSGGWGFVDVISGTNVIATFTLQPGPFPPGSSSPSQMAYNPVNGYMYAADSAGISTSFVSLIPTATQANQVYYAPISSTGVGTWTSTTPYPLWMGNGGCSIYNNNIYCVGSGAFPNNQVYYAPISSTGVGTWTSTTGYPYLGEQLGDCIGSCSTNWIPMETPTCSVYSNTIFCLGTSNTAYAKQVYYAPISSTGIGTWASTTSYPLAMDYAGCSTYSNDIYCVGTGIVAGSSVFPYANVYYAPISSTGVGTWQTTNSYPPATDEAYCEIMGGSGSYFGGGGPT